MKILLVNGPNLNLLGTRAPAIRHHACLSDIAEGVIVGQGTIGYKLALQAAAAKLNRGDKRP